MLISVHQTVELHVPLKELTNILTVRNLKYLTAYNISAASGDGIVFGEMSASIVAETQGKQSIQPAQSTNNHAPSLSHTIV